MGKLLHPALYLRSAVLGFPLFKDLVVAAFRFDHLSIIWFFVLLDLRRSTRRLFSSNRSKTASGLRI